MKRKALVILCVSFAGTVLAAAGDILDSFPASPGVHAHGGAASGGLVWQSDNTGKIIEFDCDGSSLRVIQGNVGGLNSGLAYDPSTNTFWRANRSNTIFHLDINGNIFGTIDAKRRIYALTLDPNTHTLWGGAGSTISQFDITTGTLLRTIPVPVAASFPGLSFDGQFLWYGRSSVVWQIDPDAGQILQTFSISGAGSIVAHDGQDLWTFNESTDRIQRVDDGIGPSGLPCFRGVVEVDIDIKPGSDPNCFNINGNGVIPVAILGSNTINVLDIDTSALFFAGLEVRVRGKKGPLCHGEDFNGDEFLDLVCQFEDDTSMWTPESSSEATLAGQLFDGTKFEGTDSICVTQEVEEVCPDGGVPPCPS